MFPVAFPFTVKLYRLALPEVIALVTPAPGVMTIVDVPAVKVDPVKSRTPFTVWVALAKVTVPDMVRFCKV
jgi:hypothetical protein